VLVQAIVSGLAIGGTYALIAMGMVMIYRTSHVLNFAHGEIAMFTTFIAFTLLGSPHIPVWGALFLTILSAVLIGVAMEYLIIRPARGRGANEGTYVLIMLGFFLSIQGVASWIWGTGVTRFPKIVTDEPVQALGLVMSASAMITLIVTCVLMLVLYLFFKFSLVGMAMRAMSENLNGSLLMGIRVNRIFLATWGIACAMGATAGLLVVNITYLHPGMMLPLLLKAIAGAVLGGFGSYPGVLLGCMLLALAESLLGIYVSTELKTVFAFLLITVVLLVRPTGILGTKEIYKV
jgi:branched-subunit amino acid ABC-type transport system permease component